jgi:hypothetical protein
MPGSSFHGKRYRRCGYAMKGLLFLVSCGGIVLSILSSETCEFLRFETFNATNTMDPPFDRASAGWVGIFRYEILKDENGTDAVSDGCTLYGNQFTRAPYEALISSQFCAVIAPALATIGILLALVDLFYCTFHGNFLVTCVAFLTAAGVQAGTFSIIAQPTFCFDSSVKCDVGNAVYFSAAAAVAFFISCIIICCSPKPDPCFKKTRYVEDDEPSMQETPVVTNPEISAIEQSPNRDALVTKNSAVVNKNEGDGVQWVS